MRPHCIGITALIVSLPVLAAPAQKEALPQPDRTLAYKSVAGGVLKLHFFFPPDWKASRQRPAIVFFFGGGWVGGSPAQFYPHSRHFAGLGVVSISAEYRTQNSHGTDPFACIADGKSAIRRVRAHAVEFGIHPERIVAAGGSAGGHVAASTALLPDLEEAAEDSKGGSSPNALILFNPVIDTTREGYGAEKLGSRQREASPVHHVRAGLPPTLIFHGTADTTVPFENVERFQREMRRHGNRCELASYEGKTASSTTRAKNRSIRTLCAGRKAFCGS